MSEQSISIFIAAVTIFITAAQFILSWLSGRRQRDVELTKWAHKVMELMAEIETACYPISSGNFYTPKECEILSYKASAFVDQGRLFFPNVKYIKSIGRNKGYRVKILDEVLKAHYAARHLAMENLTDRKTLKKHIYDARKNFAALLQGEMGKSMRKSSPEKAGERIDPNPNNWP